MQIYKIKIRDSNLNPVFPIYTKYFIVPIGICVSLIFIIIMFILRFWTDIDSSFYILFFFPSIIVFPYSDKTFIYRIIYIIMCMLLLFVIWRYYSVQDLIVSFSGGAFALVGSSVLASLLKKISK